MKMTGHFVVDTVQVMFLVEDTKEVAGRSCFSSHIINRCPTPSLLTAIFLHFCAIAGDFTVSKGSTHMAGVLSAPLRAPASDAHCGQNRWVRSPPHRYELRCCWPRVQRH